MEGVEWWIAWAYGCMGMVFGGVAAAGRKAEGMGRCMCPPPALGRLEATIKTG